MGLFGSAGFEGFPPPDPPPPFAIGPVLITEVASRPPYSGRPEEVPFFGVGAGARGGAGAATTGRVSEYTSETREALLKFPPSWLTPSMVISVQTVSYLYLVAQFDVSF